MRTLPIRLVVLVLLSFVLAAGCGQPAPSAPGTTVYTYRGHSSGVFKVAWSSDSKYIASGNAENIHVWEALTGKLIRTINPGSQNGGGFALSPDGKYIAAGFADQTVKVVDITTGRTQLTYTGSTGGISTIGWSPDGKYIASGNDLTMQVWDAKTGKTSLTYKVPQKTQRDTTFGLLWSPDSNYIAVGGITKTVLVLDAKTGKVRSTYSGHTEVGASPVAWSPDGKYIISASWDLTNQVWEAMTGKHIHTFQGASGAVAWSPDGKYIAFGSIFKQGEQPTDSNAHVVDATTWSTRLTYTGHAGNFNVMAVAWSPDGKYIASGGNDKTVQVWIAP